MLFILISLFFRVFPPGNLTNIFIKKQIQPKDLNECRDLSNNKYTGKATSKYTNHLIKCDGSSTENALMRYFKVNFTDHSTTTGNYLLHAVSAQVIIEGCYFLNDRFKTAMIYSTNKDISVYSTLFQNCYSIQAASSDVCLVKTEAAQGQHSDFQNNTITFADHTNSCKVFTIQFSTNCIIKGNTITRASNSATGKHCIAKFTGTNNADSPLEFANNVIDDCLGGNCALFDFPNLEYHLQFINTTFKNMKNKLSTNSGYFMNIGHKNTIAKPLVSFIECTFYYVESNAQAGSSMGLWYKGGTGSNNMALIITNCLFENIHFDSDTTLCGGAVGYNYGTSIKNAHLTVTGTTFRNVSSKYGGSAICYIVDSAQLIVENNTFINCRSLDANCKGGAIYVEFKQAMPAIVIKDCNFETASSTNFNKGNAISILQSAGNHKLTIENCHFSNCGTNGFVVFAPLTEFVATDSSINFAENTAGKSCGGISVQNCQSCRVENVQFVKSNTNPSLSIVQSDNTAGSLHVNYCTFDGWSGTTNKCFDISLGSATFSFNNNIMRNLIGSGPSNYFGSINCNSKISTLEINNMTFNDNQCKSLYGGGIGLTIEGINKLSFIDCKFLNNQALQDTTQSRSTDYYNGDGGGFQIGYSSAMNELDVLFQNCQFKQNRAFRHGGALAIQTLRTVDILNCQFEANEANSRSSSSSYLLYEDHFSKKNEGRGGAIYINPTYQSSNDDYLRQITINGCTFTSNKAFDGFAIYIEGFERVSTNFVINNNNFVNNYHPDYNTIDKSMITSEVLTLDRSMILANTFNANDQIHVSKLLYVDHSGIPPAPTSTPLPIPENAPVPFSVSISEMISTDNKECTIPVACPTNEEYESSCGQKCKSTGDNLVYYEYTFLGEGFQVFGTYGPDLHQYSIYLDDTLLITIDQNQLTETNYALQYTSRILEYGQHKVKIAGIGQVFEIYKLAFWPVINSKRINITEFTKTETWTKESDGLGGVVQYSDTNGATAKKTISASKFWVFGNKAGSHQNMDVTFGSFKDNINAQLPGSNDRINLVMLYDSPFVPLSSNELIFNLKGTVMISCVFYLDLPPPSATETPTASPSQSPTATPSLTPTPTPGPIPDGIEIPISIPISGMTVNGGKSCGTTKACTNTISTDPCGQRCWSTGDHLVTYEYTFIGEGFQVYGTYDNNHRNYDIYLDDVFLERINQQRTPRKEYSLQFTSRILPYGEHRIKIAGIGEIFEIYKIAYWPSLEAKRLNVTNLEKTGNWVSESDEIGGVRQYTEASSNAAKRPIYCSKFWVYGTKATWHRKMTVNFGDHSGEINEQITGNRQNSVLVYESPEFEYSFNELIFTSQGTVTIDCIYLIGEIPWPTLSQSPTESPTETPSQSPSETPSISPFQYDAGIFDTSSNAKNYIMQFDCPVQDGSVKIYSLCSSCNKISTDRKVYFIVYFQSGSISRIEHEDIEIHNAIKMSAFAPTNKISYESNTNTLKYYIDSVNMYYAGADVDLKCNVPPFTPRATLSQSPTETPSQSPTETPSQSPTETPSQSPTETPTQSVTATESPLPSSTPQRTNYPGTALTYINQNITNKFTDNTELTQIQTVRDNVRQVSGCIFKNVAVTNRDFYIKADAEMLFYDNIFDNDVNPTTDQAGILWDNHNGKMSIINCKFIRIASKGADSYVINTNSGGDGSNLELIIERCEFLDCGRAGRMRPLVNTVNSKGVLKFYDCNFTFSRSDFSFQVFESKNNDAIFERCRFTNCASESIRLGTSGDNPIGTFIFKDNCITNNNGRFISAEKLRSKPTIENNIIESTTLNNNYLIYILHNQAEIELINNTFSDITSTGNEGTYGGGVGIFIQSSSNEYTIKYDQCKFYNINNNHDTTTNCHGGSLQYGFSESDNGNIEIKACEIKNSNVQGGHGGGIALRSTKRITIMNSIFENNRANEENDHNGNKGFGGAIYISATRNSENNDNNNEECSESIIISGCIISNNHAYQGYGIYIQGTQTCSTNIQINNNNQFSGNEGTTTHPTGGCIIASEIVNINEEEIERSNDFSGETNPNIYHYHEVDSTGNPLGDPTETPTQSATESPSQSPTETPSQSPTETPSQSPTETPTQSATATESPLPSSTPQRTNYPGTALTYINQNITNKFTDNTELTQIQTVRDNVRQVSGCIFKNVAVTNRDFYIKADAEMLFYDNIFDNDLNPTTDQAGILWDNHNGKMSIINCKFIRIASKGADSFVINTNSGGDGSNLELIIERCEFLDCGRAGRMRPLVNTVNSKGILKFYDCNFTFSRSDFSFQVFESKNNDAIFERCRFTNCASESIRLGTSGDNPIGTFIFKDNYITNNNGRFISAEKLRSKPTIENNIIESTTLNNNYLIYILHNQAEIELINNTFSDITSTGNEGTYGGGVGIFIQSSSNEYTIKYDQCKFYNINNNHDTTTNCHGGSLQYGFSDSDNGNIEIKTCEIKNSNVQGGHGGGIALRSTKRITIMNSIFENNRANEENDHNGNKGFGGAIYISATRNSENNDNNNEECSESIIISGCIISNNHAYQGYGIYIQGTQTCSTNIQINNNNRFSGNEGTTTHPTGGCIIASEIVNINEEEIERSNDFSGETNPNIYHYHEVDSTGNPLGDPTETPTQSATESPSQSPTETPSQSPTETPSQSATESPSLSATESPSQSPTETPSQSPTETPSQSATETPSQSPTEKPSQSPAPTKTPIPGLVTVPIPVPINQMKITGPNPECSIEVECPNNINTPSCGKQCISTGGEEITYEYKFTGVVFQVYGINNNEYGSYDIYLDDIHQANIHQNQEPFGNYQLQYTSDIIAYGEHTIKVRSTENIGIYKFAFWPSIEAKRINITEFTKSEGSGWTQESDKIGGVREYTYNDGGNAKYNLKTDKFWIYGTKCSWASSAKVTLNDFEHIINLYDSEGTNDDTRKDFVLIYESQTDFTFRSGDFTITKNDGGGGKSATINFIYYIDTIPPTESPSQSPTETPSQSPTETPSQSPTETPSQSPTEHPVNTPVQPVTDTPVQPATNTPVQPVTDTPVQPVTDTPVQPVTNTPVQPATNTPVVPSTETPPTEIIVVDDNVTETKRYEKVVEDNSAVIVNIKVTNFTDIGHDDVGGAIHIENSGIKCDGLSFTNCTSTVAGGGIYINNTYDHTNSIELVDLNFIDCEAKYGGAVYIYSESRKNRIQIMRCVFQNNIATGIESDIDLYGGSAVYLTARRARLKDNIFIDNSGSNSIVKVDNNFHTNQNKLMILNDDNSVLISNCKFEKLNGNGCSLFYVRGNEGSFVELKESSFFGELNPGSHYIKGVSLSNVSPKLIVKRCKFEHDSEKSLNIKSMNKSPLSSNAQSFMSIDLGDQVFDMKEMEKFERKTSSNISIISLITAISIALVIVVLFIIFVIKRYNQNLKHNNAFEQYDL